MSPHRLEFQMIQRKLNTNNTNNNINNIYVNVCVYLSIYEETEKE